MKKINRARILLSDPSFKPKKRKFFRKISTKQYKQLKKFSRKIECGSIKNNSGKITVRKLNRKEVEYIENMRKQAKPTKKVRKGVREINDPYTKVDLDIAFNRSASPIRR